jgi:hypothetical protein
MPHHWVTNIMVFLVLNNYYGPTTPTDKTCLSSTDESLLAQADR